MEGPSGRFSSVRNGGQTTQTSALGGSDAFNLTRTMRGNTRGGNESRAGGDLGGAASKAQTPKTPDASSESRYSSWKYEDPAAYFSIPPARGPALPGGREGPALPFHALLMHSPLNGVDQSLTLHGALSERCVGGAFCLRVTHGSELTDEDVRATAKQCAAMVLFLTEGVLSRPDTQARPPGCAAASAVSTSHA